MEQTKNFSPVQKKVQWETDQFCFTLLLISAIRTLLRFYDLLSPIRFVSRIIYSGQDWSHFLNRHSTVKIIMWLIIEN